MDDERIDFLPLGTTGGTALIIGGIDEGLADRIGRTFEHTVIADWDSERLGLSTTAFKSLSFDSLLLKIGDSVFPMQQFELILILWALPYLGDPLGWVSELSERLHPRGRLVIIDREDRPMLPEQDLTIEIMRLRIEIEALKGIDLHPGYNVERLIELVQTQPFSHVRRRTFTDSDLLVGSEYWLEESKRTLALAKTVAGGSFGKLPKNLKKQAEKFRQRLEEIKPGTPPFFMITGIRKSISFATADVDMKEAATEEAVNETYLGKVTANHDTNPYDRLLLYGPDSLKNQELMSLILRGLPVEVKKGFDPEQLTRRLISEYGNRAISEERNPGRLAEMLGISLSTASLIVTVFEIGRRYYAEPHSREPIIRTPEDCYNYLTDMRSLKKEHLRGLYLNVQSRLIHDEVISIGTLSRSVVHPREVFAPALEHSANSLILAHNHPSGDLSPSEADIAVTKQLAQVGRIMGIEMLDHLIIGDGGFVSMKNKGII